MLKIKFQKIERSQLVIDIIEEKILEISSGFPKLSKSQIEVSLLLENDFALQSSDLFILKLQIMSGPYEGILISKEDSNFYSALKELIDEMVDCFEKMESKAKTKNKTNPRSKIVDFSNDLKVFRSTSLNK